MAFEWNATKAASNQAKHGVSFEEAVTVFDDEDVEFLPDPAHSYEENRLVCIGRSNQGRLLTVSFTERGADVRIISARETDKQDREDYEQGNSRTGRRRLRFKR